VGKGTRDQGLQAQSRGAAYGLSEQVLSDPFSAMLCCYVDADLRGRVVGGPFAEGSQLNQPAISLSTSAIQIG
jgi:hypothetical protein